MSGENPGSNPPVFPVNVKGWLIIAAIFALAGAVFGNPSRPAFTPDDVGVAWVLGIGSLALQWAFLGAIIGVINEWLLKQSGSYGKSALAYAINLVVFVLFAEAVLTGAAWLTGGWEGGWRSAALGAVVGAACVPLLLVVFWGTAKLFALFGSPESRAPGAAAP